MESSYYGSYRTNTFTHVHADDWTQANDHIWDSPTYFIQDWKTTPFYTALSTEITDDWMNVIYYLLYANYGNSPIASSDEHRFKIKCFSYIYQYAPAWIKRLDIQKKLRALTEDELSEGVTTQFDTALNPQNNPSSNEPIPDYINQRNKTTIKKSKMDRYGELWDLLSLDVTKEFVKRFGDLFIQIVTPDRPLLYENEIEEEN